MKPLVTILSSLVLAAGLAGPAAAEPGQTRTVLVELFTSQGCSSCPPADRALAALSEREDILALSLHVDYWDYLGWRDTFARREHTRRQYAYRDLMGARVVYTPQMIVHGAFDVVGSRGGDVAEAIERARAMPPRADIAFRHHGGMLAAELRPLEMTGPCTIWVASYRQSAEVEIERGENSGEIFTYANVVEKLLRVGEWDGGAVQSVSLPQPGPGEGVALWLQDTRTGHVAGVGFLER